MSEPSPLAVATRGYRVTSFDVAAEAGVSQSTVSRALAGDPVVSEATRLRVAEAARKLNYQVDRNAARLRTGNVHVNGAPPDFAAPFGGYKQSGNGREWGKFGFEEFLEVKAIIGYGN